MSHLRTVGLLFVVGCLCFALRADAQPPEGGRGRGGGGMLRMMVPVEQVLGFLAFDEKIALTDAQLVQIRRELKEVLDKREEVARGMQEGDREEAMEQIQVLRGDLQARLTSGLNGKQNELLKEYFQRMQDAQQRFRQGGGRGQRGQRGSSGRE
ncbi:MAG: hypothetical protein O2954_18405 [bacterium]|nr:hypothetical protein [bacterium]